MDIQLVEATPEHATAIGKIFYHAFKELMDRHQLELDIPSEEAGIQIMKGRIGNPGFFGFVILVDGVVSGGNFYSRMDSVAGVGPLVVDPSRQGLGLGRKLMQAVVDHALAHHGPQIRLLQDAINMTSLSLYTSIGYAVREPIVLLRIKPTETVSDNIRPLTIADLDACEELCQRYYRFSRRNEVAGLIGIGPEIGIVPVCIERDGKLDGYIVPGFFGHGVAGTNDDLLSMIHAGQTLSSHPAAGRWLCPSRNDDLYRKALLAGHKAMRCLNSMSVGPYDPPQGSWFTSIEL